MAADFVIVNPPRLRNLTRRPSHTCEPHLGLAYIAAVLRQAGFPVRVIDADALRLGAERTAEIAAAEDPLLIGLTAPTMMVKSAARVAELIKRRAPRAITVIGGYHATVMPGETLAEFGAFDFAVYGEGELQALHLSRASAGGRDVGSIPGLAYRGPDGVQVNPPAPRMTDLDSLPFPAWDLFPLDKYHAHYRSGNGVLELPVNVGRGCPGRCKFCARVTGGEVRRRSPENIIGEIEQDIERFGAGAIVFMDETFSARPGPVESLCSLMIERGLPKKIYWLCQTRVDSVDQRLLRLMSRAGCRHMALGIESGDPEVLARVGKAGERTKIIQAVRDAKEAGILVDNFFILGLPGDNPRTVKSTSDFAVELDSDFANFFILVPYPGTEIYEMAKRGDAGLRLMTDDWDLFGIQMGRALELEDMPRARIERAQFRAYLRFYLRPRKLRNMLRIVNLRVLPIYLWNLISSQFLAWISKRDRCEHC